MVKKRGEKRNQPENDPHHTTLHQARNKNNTKGIQKLNQSKIRQRLKTKLNQIELNQKKTIGGFVNQSFLAQPKQLGIIALPAPQKEKEKT